MARGFDALEPRIFDVHNTLRVKLDGGQQELTQTIDRAPADLTQLRPEGCPKGDSSWRRWVYEVMDHRFALAGPRLTALLANTQIDAFLSLWANTAEEAIWHAAETWNAQASTQAPALPGMRHGFGGTQRRAFMGHGDLCLGVFTLGLVVPCESAGISLALSLHIITV